MCKYQTTEVEERLNCFTNLPSQSQEKYRLQIEQWINQSLQINPQWAIPYYLKGRMLMFQKEFESV